MSITTSINISIIPSITTVEAGGSRETAALDRTAPLGLQPLY